METAVSVHAQNPSDIKAESHPYGSMAGDWLTISTDAGKVTFHDVDMVTFKNEILWAFQEWERRNGHI